MEWNIEGEIWIPFNDIRKIYKVKLEELTVLVEQEKIRFRTFLNPYDDKEFRAYAELDLEEYLPKKNVKQENLWF